MIMHCEKGGNSPETWCVRAETMETVTRCVQELRVSVEVESYWWLSNLSLQCGLFRASRPTNSR